MVEEQKEVENTMSAFYIMKHIINKADKQDIGVKTAVDEIVDVLKDHRLVK